MDRETMESSKQAEYQHHARQLIEDLKAKKNKNFAIVENGTISFYEKASETRKFLDINDPEIIFALAEKLASKNMPINDVATLTGKTRELDLKFE